MFVLQFLQIGIILNIYNLLVQFLKAQPLDHVQRLFDSSTHQIISLDIFLINHEK